MIIFDKSMNNDNDKSTDNDNDNGIDNCAVGMILIAMNYFLINHNKL